MCVDELFGKFSLGLKEVRLSNVAKGENPDVLPWHLSMAYLSMSDMGKMKSVKMWDTSKAYGDVTNGDGAPSWGNE